MKVRELIKLLETCLMDDQIVVSGEAGDTAHVVDKTVENGVVTLMLAGPNDETVALEVYK